MASGNTMIPTTESPKPKKESKVAKSKVTGSKSGLASKMKIQAGPSGKMHKMTGVKPQKPGVSHNTNSGGGGGYAKK